MEDQLAAIGVLLIATFVLVAVLGFKMEAEHNEIRKRLDRMEKNLLKEDRNESRRYKQGR